MCIYFMRAPFNVNEYSSLLTSAEFATLSNARYDRFKKISVKNCVFVSIVKKGEKLNIITMLK